jgi:hypothetical protein
MRSELSSTCRSEVSWIVSRVFKTSVSVMWLKKLWEIRRNHLGNINLDIFVINCVIILDVNISVEMEYSHV